MVERLPAFSSSSSRWWRQVTYRIRQFIRGIHPRIEAEEKDFIAEVLSEPALALFSSMPRDAQRHSLNVLYSAQATGNQHPDLAVAALLHDVGKAAAEDGGLRLGLWLRGPLVLLEALSPDTLHRLAARAPDAGWRYMIHVHLFHAQIGAEWAAEAGCSQLACWLIQHHQDRLCDVSPTQESFQLLSELQRADNSN